jgi:D-alanine-D-alanine ligase-like ATP-grasp enzyme
MDKLITSEKIRDLNIPGIQVARQHLLSKNEISKYISTPAAMEYWKMLIEELGSKTIIVKPRGDGCSAGVVRLFSSKDLQVYLSLLKKRSLVAKAHTFTNQPNDTHMPEEPTDVLFEPFIETDKLRTHEGKISHVHKSGYVEMTVGVLEVDGIIKALPPSITIAEQSVLSVEEKFQGGTGVNITPPPREIITPKKLERVKTLVEKVATEIGINGYSRIDIFVEIRTGNIMVIEVNTLPGLTPSTVIFHQALAQNPPIYPVKFLENIIQNAGY